MTNDPQNKQVFGQAFFGTIFAIGFLFVTFNLINNAFRTDPSSDKLRNQIDEQSGKIQEYACEYHPESKECKEGI